MHGFNFVFSTLFKTKKSIHILTSLNDYTSQAPRTITGNIPFGKRDTQFGEWPHMCAVLREIALGATEKVQTYICGASLIAPHIVLTAAHCVQ